MLATTTQEAVHTGTVKPALDEARFARLSLAKRVWAVGAIHGDAEQLKAIHAALYERFRPGDRFVYMGNYSGPGGQVIETYNELLRARRKLLAQAGYFEPCDFVYLRGALEEMWSKLLQIQFATNPREILEWLLEHGMVPMIEAYGSTVNAARGHIRDGVLAITKWTSALRANVHKNPGHFDLTASLKRAAYTECGNLLFVHASIDPTQPLTSQGDIFWWDTGVFDSIHEPYEGFRRIIRGYDRKQRGLQLQNPYTATLDGGAGYGGRLSAVCFTTDGQVDDQIIA